MTNTQFDLLMERLNIMIAMLTELREIEKRVEMAVIDR